jgi:ABC-type Mn2+/Zn2+ transport system ATPase subunit
MSTIEVITFPKTTGCSALDTVSLTLTGNESTVCWQNGAGKTTLIKRHHEQVFADSGTC